MFDLAAYLDAFFWMLGLGVLGWLYSVFRQNVTIVDSLWALFFLLATLSFHQSRGWTGSERGFRILALVSCWAFRLSAYLARRNRGPCEDKRYAAIRRSNEPHFWLKSLYIVFGLQALLAWIISLPLHGAVFSRNALSFLDAVGAALWVFGFLWESVADLQLARFRSDPAHGGKVLDSGLWRYSRHPNYFGECVLWWGYYCIAAAGGAWWSHPAPVLMTFLLLKVSGVALLEQTIGERRPEYAAYVRRTSAFIPWRSRA